MISMPVLEAIREGRLLITELKNVSAAGVNIETGPTRHLVYVEAFQTGTAIGTQFIFVQLSGNGPGGADLEVPAGYGVPIQLQSVTRVAASAAGVGPILVRLWFLSPASLSSP